MYSSDLNRIICPATQLQGSGICFHKYAASRRRLASTQKLAPRSMLLSTGQTSCNASITTTPCYGPAGEGPVCCLSPQFQCSNPPTNPPSCDYVAQPVAGAPLSSSSSPTPLDSGVVSCQSPYATPCFGPAGEGPVCCFSPQYQCTSPPTRPPLCQPRQPFTQSPPSIPSQSPPPLESGGPSSPPAATANNQPPPLSGRPPPLAFQPPPASIGDTASPGPTATPILTTQSPTPQPTGEYFSLCKLQ